ncbi:MAG TPA: hypothetical protein VJU84_06585 [Pyrinomonadaceae bacterium]|nr:hypothetical protein [Pyrinomonadaceae bacterium]
MSSNTDDPNIREFEHEHDHHHHDGADGITQRRISMKLGIGITLRSLAVLMLFIIPVSIAEAVTANENISTASIINREAIARIDISNVIPDANIGINDRIVISTPSDAIGIERVIPDESTAGGILTAQMIRERIPDIPMADV